MFKLECFTQAFAMIKYFSVFPRGINTETPSLAETNDAAKLLRKDECCKFSNAPFCAGAEWRTMAHFFGGVFLNFSENYHLQPFFPTPFHKSGDKPLPCQKKAVILQRIRHLGSQWLIPRHLISGRPRPLLSPKIRDFRGLHKGKAMRSDEDSLRRLVRDNDNVNDNDNKLPTPTLFDS